MQSGKADGSLSIAHLLVELAQRSNGHTLELALGVRKVDSPRSCTLLGRGHELRQVQRYTLVRYKGGWCRTSRLNRVLPDLPGELLRVSSSLEMHEGITLIAGFSRRNPTLLPVVEGKVQVRHTLGIDILDDADQVRLHLILRRQAVPHKRHPAVVGVDEVLLELLCDLCLA